MKRFTPLLFAALTSCVQPPRSTLDPLPPLPGQGAVATPRVNGSVGAVEVGPAAQVSYGRPAASGGAASSGTAAEAGGGDISLDFADTDIREVVAQILGGILRVDYTIDPAVRGTATLRTVVPLSRAQLVPTLETLLAQNGATLVRSGPVYRVMPNTATGPAGSTVVPLRYASADALAKVLAPFVGAGGKVVAEPGRNALIVSGEAGSREAINNLIAAFDTDLLSGQSYALLPVGSGSAKDFAAALGDALRGAGGAALAGQVRVVPMDRVDAVLVVSSQPRYVDEARRVFALVERARRATVRSWHVYYLQSSRSSDIAHILQRAFTPNDVTAQPGGAPGATAPGQATQGIAGGISGGLGAGSGLGTGGGLGGLGGGLANGVNGGLSGGLPGIGTAGGGAGLAASPAFGGGNAAPAASNGGGNNPLLGGLPGAEGGGDANAMRIVPNPQNNAVLIYATRAEQDTVEAMLRKIDILPLQVRIDATIAEVDLNDALQYGVQYFFSAGVNGLLSTTGTRQFGPFTGFSLTGPASQSAAINALQDVTKVRVLSAPQLMVVDNQAAHLQVGQLVPILTQQSQSQLTSNANIVNSVSYQPTGVILQVTPRVNSGGMVTMDISQEVSSVVPQATGTQTTGSPTFQERQVQSRVVVQDGQTVGLAGLIQDQDQRESSGIPFLKDVPLLGFLAGTQNNSRQRTELLVLITPHVVHDQRDARALTQDLREGLRGAALTPFELQRTPADGFADPQQPYRRKVEQTR